LRLAPDADGFEARWASASATFADDRCDAVAEELGKRLPMPHGPEARASSPSPRGPAAGEILILTPLKDARRHLPRYLELLGRLDAGGAPLSVAFLEGDSPDGGYEALAAAAPSLERQFHRVEIHKRDEGFELHGPRWAPEIQHQRRAVIARARNHLLSAALAQAEWVLWLDVDLADYPSDLLLRLLETGKDIVTPHCVFPDGRSFDLNTFILADGATQEDDRHKLNGLYQPPRGAGRRYLEDVADQALVRVDSVGATALLVRGDLHRQGLNFPAYSYGGYIESEGLAMMARDMGHACWALPGLRIVHPDDPAPADAPPPASRDAQPTHGG
jgi:hypothetical protein